MNSRMNKRKARSTTAYTCAHCGFQIAVIYDTGDGQVLESHPGKLRSGFGVAIYDATSGRATILCPDCGKVTPVTWLLKSGRKTRVKS